MAVRRYVLYAQPTRRLAWVVSYSTTDSPVDAAALVRIAMKGLKVRRYLG